MFRTGLFACLLFSGAGHAMAADLSPVCEGFVGTWQVVDDASMKDGKSWGQDLSEGRWRVEARGVGKCRFVSAKGEIDFDLDTTRGTYDTTLYENGKAQPPQSYQVVSFGADGPRAWMLTAAIPSQPGAKQAWRMIMTVAGDLLLVETAAAATPDGDFVPRGLTVHRRVPK